MPEHELEKLLGGFAADTLTPEERDRLFTAALHDQELFNALADEQALKELLADPAVRGRLLDQLHQAAAAPAGPPRSWLDGFKQPARLALAGGLAAAVAAIVLGTKLYQDSLRQSPQQAATEESAPAFTPPSSDPPSAAIPAAPLRDEAPEPIANEHRRSSTESNTGEALQGGQMKRETSASPNTEPQSSPPMAPESAGRSSRDKPEHEPAQPGLDRDKAEETPAVPAQPTRPETPEPPAVPAHRPPAPRAQSAGSAAMAAAQRESARALFYATEPERSEQAVGAREERGPGSQPEARQPLRAEPKMRRFSATPGSAPVKPLGLRYGFAIRAADGTARETDAATALKSGDQGRLTIEVNQDAFLQIWKTTDSSAPELWFPTEDAGQTSVTVPGGRRQGIPFSQEQQPFTLVVRLSRVPLGTLTEQEVAALAVPSNQLEETVTPDQPAGSQEQATYVINKNSSPTVQLIAKIAVAP
ncbi:MAG TPA: hypothetical protein VFS39_00860 [Nitrospira sp.]|nr:hypothetical protein [Nitrospira sp.]